MYLPTVKYKKVKILVQPMCVFIRIDKKEVNISMNSIIS